jgi:serine/threonine protein kinase
VVPLVEHGNLNSVLIDLARLHPEFMDLHQKLLFSRDIAQGMVYLAGQGVVHRDLATRNSKAENDGVLGGWNTLRQYFSG